MFKQESDRAQITRYCLVAILASGPLGLEDLNDAYSRGETVFANLCYMSRFDVMDLENPEEEKFYALCKYLAREYQLDMPVLGTFSNDVISKVLNIITVLAQRDSELAFKYANATIFPMVVGFYNNLPVDIQEALSKLVEWGEPLNSFYNYISEPPLDGKG